MRSLSVVGLSADGQALVLRAGADVFSVGLDELSRAQQALPFVEEPPPTPREVQQRIRQGESSAQIARLSGLPVEAVARYEGPPLAEREHQAQRARAVEVDGRPVGELVEEHVARVGLDPADTAWDAVLVEPGRWEVTARVQRLGLRLRWEPGPRRVVALDETARQALRLAALEEDALGAVLRPVSSWRGTALPAEPADSVAAGSEPTDSVAADAVSADSVAARAEVPSVAPGAASDRSAVAEAPVEPSLIDLLAADAADAADLDADDVDETHSDTDPDAEASADLDPEPHADPPHVPPVPARGAARGRRGRASVPTWDAISTEVSGRGPAPRREG